MQISSTSFSCKACGAWVSLLPDDEIAEEMVSEKFCMTCAMWHRLSRRPKSSYVIVVGKYYAFRDVKTGRRLRTAVRFDGRTFTSALFVNYGKVPDYFRPMLPDNAVFAPRSQRRLAQANDGYSCHRKGCWDRMQCVWFRMDETDWNKIPKNHKTGDENCPLFINKNIPND